MNALIALQEWEEDLIKFAQFVFYHLNYIILKKAN